MQLSTTAAVITGGASGLGEATARYFAENGAQVTILDRDAEIPSDLARVIDQAINPDPGERLPTAEAFKHALVEASGSIG